MTERKAIYIPVVFHFEDTYGTAVYLESGKSLGDVLLPLVAGRVVAVWGDGSPALECTANSLKSWMVTHVFPEGTAIDMRGRGQEHGPLLDLDLVYFPPYSLLRPEVFGESLQFPRKVSERGPAIAAVDGGSVWLLNGRRLSRAEILQDGVRFTDFSDELPKDFQAVDLLKIQGNLYAHDEWRCYRLAEGELEAERRVQWDEVFRVDRKSGDRLMAVQESGDSPTAFVCTGGELWVQPLEQVGAKENLPEGVCDHNLRCGVVLDEGLVWADHMGKIHFPNGRVVETHFAAADFDPIHLCTAARHFVLQRGGEFVLFDESRMPRVRFRVEGATHLSAQNNLLCIRSPMEVRLLLIHPELYRAQSDLYRCIPRRDVDGRSATDVSLAAAGSTSLSGPTTAPKRNRSISSVAARSMPVPFFKPFDISRPYRASREAGTAAREAVQGLDGPSGKASALFEWVKANFRWDRYHSHTLFSERPAADVFRSRHGLSGELAYLFVGMAREVDLKASWCLVQREEGGHSAEHSCAAIPLGTGAAVLADPTRGEWDARYPNCRTLNEEEFIKELARLRVRHEEERREIDRWLLETAQNGELDGTALEEGIAKLNRKALDEFLGSFYREVIEYLGSTGSLGRYRAEGGQRMSIGRILGPRECRELVNVVLRRKPAGRGRR